MSEGSKKRVRVCSTLAMQCACMSSQKREREGRGMEKAATLRTNTQYKNGGKEERNQKVEQFSVPEGNIEK